MNDNPHKKYPTIDKEACLTCRCCVGICPSGAIYQLRREISIDTSICNKCGLCAQSCPSKAISLSSDISARTDTIKVDLPRHLDRPYDIIIVGGGIAGLSTAFGALEVNPALDILILEKKRTIGEDVNSSAATWHFTLDLLPLTPLERSSIILQEYTRWGIASEKESTVIDFSEPFAQSIDLSRLQQVISYKLLKKGAQIETNSFADTVKRTKDGFELTINSNGTSYTLKSRLLVDSSGIDSRVSQKLGLHKSWKKQTTGIGAEYEMTWQQDPTIGWLIDMKHRKLGYAWSFPIGNDLSRIGLSLGERNDKATDEFNLHLELDNLIRTHFLIKQNTGNKSSRVNFKCGAYPLNGITVPLISDRMLRVGDAASHANPLIGEGIYYCIRFGLKAGEVLARSTTGHIHELKPYQDYVKKESKKFDTDKRGFDVDFNVLISKIDEVKDRLSKEEKWTLLGFIMPGEPDWTARIRLVTKLLGYKEAMRLFGSVAKKEISKIF